MASVGGKTKMEQIREVIPMVGIMVCFPIQFSAAWIIFMIAQFFRASYKVLMAPKSQRTNLRVLVITDYMPPQTHGIAIRFARYVSHMRQSGHEAHVFTTAMHEKAITSFDHPVLPCISNPWNGGNLMAYCPGLELAWYLGANSWDIVHIAYPSTLSWFVLPACRWRNIPTYCSHHVDMDLYMRRYMPIYVVWLIGVNCYNLFIKWPSQYWGTLNASMTKVFLKMHMPKAFREDCLTDAIPTGIADDRFCVDHAARVQIRQAHSIDDDIDTDPLSAVIALKEANKGKLLWVMVQRVAVEKDIHKMIEAMPQAVGDAHVIIAGDGPARAGLEELSIELGMTEHISFIGNIPNAELPRLYRMADCFVTCSISETYGLTLLEALASGTPIAYPECPVFDEIWQERLPAAWRYNQESAEGLLAAARTASTPEAHEWLKANPVAASWKQATERMLEQYRHAIAFGKKRKMERPLASLVERAEQIVRVALIMFFIYWIGRAYFKMAYEVCAGIIVLFGTNVARLISTRKVRRWSCWRLSVVCRCWPHVAWWSVSYLGSKSSWSGRTLSWATEC